jgi:hypothetical protein
LVTPCAPPLEPFGRQLLGISALLNEGRFQRHNLAIEQEIGLMDQADDRIGPHRRFGMLQPRRVKRPPLLVVKARRKLLASAQPRPNRPHGLGFGSIALPERQMAVAQEVFAVEQQFFKTGSCHIEQAQLRLRRDG